MGVFWNHCALNKLWIISLVLLPHLGIAQIQLSRQVIAAVGMEGTGSYLIQSSVGQPEYETFDPDTLYVLTQGFQQPDREPMVLNIATIWPDCDNGEGATVVIEGVEGCAYEDPEFFWEEVLLTDSVLFNVQPGQYAVSVFAGIGCLLDINYTVPEPPIPPCGLEFFNAFTPNGDGENDVWEIGNVVWDRYQQNAVQIYNRWGNLVWEAHDYDNNATVFRGEHQNGSALPDGTYYYLVEADGITYQGFIELLR